MNERLIPRRDTEVKRQRCETLVVALVGKNLANDWWNSYNKAFSKTPEEQFNEDYSVVYAYLMGHAGL